MSYCIKCGEKLGEEDLFCFKCGTKVIKVASITQDFDNHVSSNMDFAEELIFTKAANLFRGYEGVGGKLTVTNKRLIFKPHAFNVQSQAEEIPFENISSAGKSNNAGIIPNGMTVYLKNGDSRKFVIWGRDKVIDYINSRVNAK